jgi:hypothetical protein
MGVCGEDMIVIGMRMCIFVEAHVCLWFRSM